MWASLAFLLPVCLFSQSVPLFKPYTLPTKHSNLISDKASNLVALRISKPGSNLLYRFEFSEPHMGTEFQITCYAPSDSLAKTAAAAAFRRIEELEQIMSDYRADSELNQLSDTAGGGTGKAVSDDLWQVLSFSKSVSWQSNGAFDVCIGQLSKLWRRAFRQKEFPSQEEITAAMRTTGTDALLLKDKTALLHRPGARLDLGGVAKGYAVDEAMEVLRSHSITSALVVGGGDVLAGNPPPGTSGWLIERPAVVADTLGSDFIQLSNRAISTSGATYRFLEWEGKRYSHIIDPRMGYGITTRQLVTVTAPSSMEADAWATAFSVSQNETLIKKLKEADIGVMFVPY